MKWSWPFPTYNPWDRPTSTDFIVPDKDTPVHSVEAATWLDYRNDRVTMQTADGRVISYFGLQTIQPRASGDSIPRGTYLGQVCHDGYRSYRGGIHMTPPLPPQDPNGTFPSREIDTPETLTLLQAAWSRITHRVHRDLPPPRSGKAEIMWLLEHPIWTYPDTVRMPPEGFVWPTGLFPADEEMARWPEIDSPSGYIWQCVDQAVHYVDPTLEQIEDDDSRNTAFRVWLESGPWTDLSAADSNWPVPAEGWTKYNKWSHCHDINLDCGGKDLEEALLHLATLVRFFYGDGRESLPGKESCDVPCLDAGDGFCQRCGHLISDPWKV